MHVLHFAFLKLVQTEKMTVVWYQKGPLLIFYVRKGSNEVIQNSEIMKCSLDLICCM